MGGYQRDPKTKIWGVTQVWGGEGRRERKTGSNENSVYPVGVQSAKEEHLPAERGGQKGPEPRQYNFMSRTTRIHARRVPLGQGFVTGGGRKRRQDRVAGKRRGGSVQSAV